MIQGRDPIASAEEIERLESLVLDARVELMQVRKANQGLGTIGILAIKNARQDWAKALSALNHARHGDWKPTLGGKSND